MKKTAGVAVSITSVVVGTQLRIFAVIPTLRPAGSFAKSVGGGDMLTEQKVKKITGGGNRCRSLVPVNH